MLNYIIRRLLLAIPTLLFISLIIFLLLDLAPGDPLADQPLTIPAEVREKMRSALGLDAPAYVRYLLWLKQFCWVEPLTWLDRALGTHWAAGEQRILSWQFRAPAIDIMVQRLPQTLIVIGISYLAAIMIAIPIGIVSAYRQYSWFDQIGTLFSTIGFSVPTFFTGVLLIVIFSVGLGWFPSIYDTTLEVTDFSTFMLQVRQMIMPVTVLALFNAAQMSRFMRSSVLENLRLDYVRTARAKGLGERAVILVHVLRNSLIPVITIVALGVPTIFGGAIITEQVFKVNGLGQLLITAIEANDVPMVQTLTVIFAFLIVLFNLIADALYGVLDPRIRYD